MIVYLDSSVILRVLLGQPAKLKEWTLVEKGIVSSVVEVECLRTLDRLRLRENIPETDIAARRESVYLIMDSVEMVEMTSIVLARASQPLPVSVGTLDAIHLATAMVWREQTGDALIMATHDAGLGQAARSVGLPVISC